MKRTVSLIIALSLLLSSCTLPRFPSIEAPPATLKPRATSTLAPAPNIELFTMPDAGMSWLLARIEKAKTRVLMKMYMLTDDRVTTALQQAKRNGASVRVMIEQRPFGASAIADEAYQSLRKAGLETKHASPAFRLTHEKSFVIDDTAIILTANMTRSSFSRNREFAGITTDPAQVQEIADSFEADWNRKPFAAQVPSLVWSPISSRNKIGALIETARNTLEVYAISAVDEAQVAQLVAAAKRGVKVRLLTSAVADDEGDKADTSGWDDLQRGGVQVRLLKSPVVHAKVFVADGRTAFMGSVNISTASLDYNRELGVIFDDAAAISKIHQTFEKDWAKSVER